MDFDSVRRLVIQAAFADDFLLEHLVLKGGNALALVHQIGSRSSIDVDFSLADDIDISDLRERLRLSLEDRFDGAGYEVFDFKIERKPADASGRPPTWGGYRVSFKLLDKSRRGLLPRLVDRRRQALVVAPDQQRNFTIEISRHEYTAAKQEAELEGFAIYVYPPAMIAVEKVRAICQQMPEYQLVRNKRGRARDFYDIHSIATARRVDFGSVACQQLARHVFAAKEVPLSLIARIPEQREFHRPDWPAVEATVTGELGTYDFYFDWVVEETRKLQPLWEE